MTTHRTKQQKLAPSFSPGPRPPRPRDPATPKGIHILNRSSILHEPWDPATDETHHPDFIRLSRPQDPKDPATRTNANIFKPPRLLASLQIGWPPASIIKLGALRQMAYDQLCATGEWHVEIIVRHPLRYGPGGWRSQRTVARGPGGLRSQIYSYILLGSVAPEIDPGGNPELSAKGPATCQRPIWGPPRGQGRAVAMARTGAEQGPGQGQSIWSLWIGWIQGAHQTSLFAAFCDHRSSGIHFFCICRLKLSILGQHSDTFGQNCRLKLACDLSSEGVDLSSNDADLSSRRRRLKLGGWRLKLCGWRLKLGPCDLSSEAT